MADAPRQRGLEIGDIAPHLFLSHSSRDNETVRRIAWDLNVCGVDVWFDEWELRVGDDLHNRIANAISKSKFVGVVIGDHFDSSKWMRGEVSQALWSYHLSLMVSRHRQLSGARSFSISGRSNIFRHFSD